jgi:hypothetical protein
MSMRIMAQGARVGVGVLFVIGMGSAWGREMSESGAQVSSSEVSDLVSSLGGGEAGGEGRLLDRLSLQYFGLLYGPSVRNPSSYQPDVTSGREDRSRPLILKNSLGLAYEVSDQVSVTPTLCWIWQPVLRHETTIEDPFLKVAHSSLFSYGNLNLYADARIHFPVSRLSKENQQMWGAQSVQVLTYEVENSRLTLGLYGAERYNLIRQQSGQGNDLELYVAPNLSYQVHPRVALTLIYEIRNSHTFGERAFLLQNDAMDIEPGVSWDVTPHLMVNPYLHIPTKGSGLASTSVGMLMSWNLF